MKSISIVYKKPSVTEQPQHKDTQANSMRRTVNNFYSKIVQKGVNRQDLIQRIRTQTARGSRILGDRNTVVSSLSIASIMTPQSATPQTRSSTHKKAVSQPMFHVKKHKQNNNFFSLKLPEQHPVEQLPPTIITFNKNIKQQSKHSKVKLLTKVKCEKQATLILWIDFIFNQFNFWEEEEVEEQCSKTWKQLSNFLNILWLVRSESTCKKLLAFAHNKGLRVDGVLQIQPIKKETLTISYLALQSQVKFVKNHRILIIGCLKGQNRNNEFQFRNSLPIISNFNTSVHFVKIDMGIKDRIKTVKKVITQPFPKPFDLSLVFQQHKQRKQKGSKFKQNVYSDQELQQIDPLQKFNQLKQNLLISFEQSFGLKTKIQQNSITYIVGDMLKRNIGIARSFYSYCQQVEQNQKVSKQNINNFVSIAGKFQRHDYNRMVYVWD